MSTSPVILDRGGRSGLVESESADRVRVRLPSGGGLDLPAALVDRHDDGSLRTDLSFEALDPGPTAVLYEVDERVRIRTQTQETGRVVAHVVTDTHDQPVEAHGWRESVDVERVPIDRVVDAVEPPREEDGVTIVPVYEEVLVVQKRLVLREELRLTTRREALPGPASVSLRRQRVEVERLPPTDADDSAD